LFAWWHDPRSTRILPLVGLGRVPLAGPAIWLALLVQSAHWLSDVTGGALLAMAILAVASVSPLGDSSRGHQVLGSLTGSRALSHHGYMDDRTPPRIGVVHSFYSSRQTSGENRVVEQQVEALGRSGYTVGLFAQRTDDRERSKTYPVTAAATVATGRGPSPLAQLHEFTPDAVLVHNLFPNYGRTWVSRWDGPLIAFMHNYRSMCANGLFFRNGTVCTDCLDARSSRPAVQHACYRGSRVATLPVAVGTKFGDDPLLRRADKVVVLNRRASDLYRQAGVDDSRISVIPNFLSRPAQVGGGGGPWLFVGRLSDYKGILPLVREWPSDEPLLVVGSGPLREDVKRSAPPGVVLLGEQPAERVSQLMRSARGLVFPSRCFEGLPMVYLEALAAGTPVLAWEPSVVSDMVREEGTGLVVGDLSEALRDAETTFPSMRLRCRAVFEERYTKHAWLRSMGRLLGWSGWRRQPQHDG
jgi:glycosyltransferase involved in cell wall biosynthesis